MNDFPDRTTARWLTFAGLSVAAFAACAGDASVGPSGIMTFPNVQVVNVPAPVASKALAAQDSMRAFVDPATGKLVPPSAEQAAALEAANPAQSASNRRQRSLAPTIAPAEIYPAQGGVGITLDESTMSYSVARKEAGGKVSTQCIPGSDLAHWKSKKSATRHSHKTPHAGEQK